MSIIWELQRVGSLLKTDVKDNYKIWVVWLRPESIHSQSQSIKMQSHTVENDCNCHNIEILSLLSVKNGCDLLL